MKNIFIISFSAIFCLVISCKKEASEPDSSNQNNPQETTTSSCDYNTGYFNITIDSNTYEFNPDSVTLYVIFYDYSQQNTTAFHVEGKDMNGDKLMMTFWIPDPFQLGTHTYSEDSGTLTDFDIWAGPGYLYSLYVSEVEIDMQEANLVNEGGVNIYRSAIGSFTAPAYSINPVDTFNVSGEFCLNGWFAP